MSETWPVYSPFARQHFDAGKQEGRQEGRAEGEADALLTVLDARGIEVPESARVRISECTDVEALKGWLKRAVLARSVDEIFD
ncbi:MAG: hypothetical protein ACJ72W_24605 [Actinoallomurus sp.]